MNETELFMNIPWLVAPLVSIPFIFKQLTYLIRKNAVSRPATATRPRRQQLANQGP